MAELAPLKLDKARFRVAVEPLAEDRAGAAGMDRVGFEIATNPGARSATWAPSPRAASWPASPWR